MDRHFVSCLALVLWTFHSAFPASNLPPLPTPNGLDQPDWLIDSSSYKAGVYQGPQTNEIVLSNGLIQRRFRLAPNAATVGFDNLITKESLLRGVKPEAQVELDGVLYDIGGLKGQPNYAFLRPEWIKLLQADPEAFQFEGFETGQPRERLSWKRLRHHAPLLEWPPKGLYLRMDYRMPKIPRQSLSSTPQPSAKGRRMLLAEDFKALDQAWKIHASPAHPRSSFSNEGKTGEIYTPANTAVFAERALPEGTRLVEATMHPGTDNSSSWGPGLALVWPDHTIKFNLRPGGNATLQGTPLLGLWDGKMENPGVGGKIQLDLSKPWTLRLRIESGTVFCEARSEGSPWKLFEQIVLDPSAGFPTSVRVGKMDRTGGKQDYSDPGDLVRLRVLNLTVYSGLEKAALAAMEASRADRQKIKVSVHYELYDGLPCLSKWITVHNGSRQPVTVNRFTSEILAAVEHSSRVEDRGIHYPPPNIHVETDYSFQGMDVETVSKHSVHWVNDPQYTSQVQYLRNTPCLLEVRPEIGPDQVLEPGEEFTSFRAFVMPYDSYDRERKGLANRRLYRTLAPWTTENPLMMHARFADWNRLKTAIDQSAEVGFEMVILTFGSGFDIENENEDYLATMREYADYARSKGIELGGYSLLSSRRIGGGQDVISPPDHSPVFGNAPCLQSTWGQDYFRKLYQFYDKTGHQLLEHDGSYPGDFCMSDEHPGHRGLEDSQWNQWRMIADFYKWCRSKGIYLNVPDYYYLAGSNKNGMGYREVNWSLPRAEQVFHTRQNIYDGTWTKSSSMGWMFVPLTQYHGGGAAATIEPLDEHLDHYERMMLSNLALGVQACYRGPRLYDTDRTKAMVKQSVDWYKKYRDILESDLIHGRRADGQDLDWMLHVNPNLKEKGLLAVFNPLPREVFRRLKVNLYYTGLTDTARIREQEGSDKKVKLARDYSVQLDVAMKPESFTWYVVE